LEPENIVYQIGNDQIGYVRSFQDYSNSPKLATILAEKVTHTLPKIEIINENLILKSIDEAYPLFYFKMFLFIFRFSFCIIPFDLTRHSNRAQCEFSNRFAVVTFVVHKNSAKNEALATTYHRVLNDGFEFNGRNYEFLASSDSQMRKCSCVFLAVSGIGLEPLAVSSITTQYSAYMHQIFTPFLSFPFLFLFFFFLFSFS